MLLLSVISLAELPVLAQASCVLRLQRVVVLGLTLRASGPSNEHRLVCGGEGHRVKFLLCTAQADRRGAEGISREQARQDPGWALGGNVLLG